MTEDVARVARVKRVKRREEVVGVQTFTAATKDLCSHASIPHREPRKVDPSWVTNNRPSNRWHVHPGVPVMNTIKVNSNININSNMNSNKNININHNIR